MKETITYIVTDIGESGHYGNLDAPSYDKAVENALAFCEQSKNSQYPVDISNMEIHKRTVRMEKMELDK